MEPYEVLYGRPCRSSICWTKTGEKYFMGLELVWDTCKKVDLIQKHLLKAQN